MHYAPTGQLSPRTVAATPPHATPAHHVALGVVPLEPATQVPPPTLAGDPPAPNVPELLAPGVVPVGLQPTQMTGEPAPAYEASSAPVESREAPHMKGLLAAVQAKPAAEGASAASLRDIRVLLEQALAQCREEAASSGQAKPAPEGVVTGGHSYIRVLMEQALAASRHKEAVGK